MIVISKIKIIACFYLIQFIIFNKVTFKKKMFSCEHSQISTVYVNVA